MLGCFGFIFLCEFSKIGIKFGDPGVFGALLQDTWKPLANGLVHSMARGDFFKRRSCNTAMKRESRAVSYHQVLYYVVQCDVPGGEKQMSLWLRL